MMRKTAYHTIAVATVALWAALNDAWAEPPAPALAAVTQTTELLLAGRPLELSTDKSTAADRFYFAVEYHSKVDGRLARGLDVLVCRDRGSTALLIRYADGLPYCYLTRGLAVMFDPATKGLRVWRKGNTRFCLRATDQSFLFELGQRAEHLPAEFVLDLGSVLKLLPTARTATFDPGTQILQFATAKMSVAAELVPPSDGPRFPIERLSVEGLAGNHRVAVGRFRVNQDAPLPMFGVTPDALKATGLPVVEFDELEMRGLNPFPAESTLAEDDARAAAARFMRMFQRPPATK
jgi:hypothetical protein